VIEAKVDHVLVALRYVGARGNPGANEYLAAFQSAEWNVSGYAVLGGGVLLPAFVNGILIPNAQTASNEIAAQLRSAWGIR
jgi:hypothetical protein